VTRAHLLLLPLLLAGCTDLDWTMHNPVHCSRVDEATCEESDNHWDAVCLKCEDPYDLARDYDWMDTTLAEGQAVRAVDPATVELFTIDSLDGEAQLDAFWIPAHGADPDLADVTVVYYHGNYAGLEHYLPRIRFLHEFGVNVLAWDFRGYGKSLPDASPSVEQFFADAQQVRRIAERYAPVPEKIVLYANSLGAFATVDVAVHDPTCALFLEAPAVNASGAVRSATSLDLPEGFFSSGLLDSPRKIIDYDGPLLVMHGAQDNFFPLEDVQDLYDAAPGPKRLWVVPDAMHGLSNGGVPEMGLTPYFDTMRAFLEEVAPQCM